MIHLSNLTLIHSRNSASTHDTYETVTLILLIFFQFEIREEHSNSSTDKEQGFPQHRILYFELPADGPPI